MKAEDKRRCIQENFFESLLSGRLKGLLELIKKDDKLQLCFRGKYISVYYKGDSLFKIEPYNKYDKISFNFNHARYTPNAIEQRERLVSLGYNYSEGGENGGSIRREVACKYPPNNVEVVSCDFWGDSSKVLKSLIDDFLDLEKVYDYFKKEKKNGKSCHLERQRQQDIMRENNSLDGEYFIYDIEYDQPRNSTDEAKSGRFDMLALRCISEGFYNLVFIELKSIVSACAGRSGIKKHYSDLKAYIKKGRLIDARKSDAIKICEYYGLLGLVKQKRIQIKGEEILFVFTDDAIEYADRVGDTKEKCILLSNNLKLKYNKELE